MTSTRTTRPRTAKQLARLLLETARHDAPPPGARARAASALGVGEMAALLSATLLTGTRATAHGAGASSGVISVKSLIGAGTAKWFAGGVAAVALGAGASHVAGRPWRGDGASPRDASALALARVAASADDTRLALAPSRESRGEPHPDQPAPEAEPRARRQAHLPSPLPSPHPAPAAPTVTPSPLLPALAQGSGGSAGTAMSEERMPPQGLEPSAAPTSRPRGARSVEDPLAREVKHLDRARQALRREEAAEASQILRLYLARSPRGVLRAEALALLIVAQLEQGQRDAALHWLQALRSEHPESPYLRQFQELTKE